jgi:S-adenosylmethionine:tRNA ribosyltransferase-isomerase
MGWEMDVGMADQFISTSPALYTTPQIAPRESTNSELHHKLSSSMPDPEAHVSAYDYELPPDRIAAEPLPERDAARMLVLDRKTQRSDHHTIRDLPALLNPGDCLVLNDTRVIPARLFGRRTSTGGRWEGLFLGTTPDGNWRLIGQTRGRLQPGESITLVPAHDDQGNGDLPREFLLWLVALDEDGVWTARPDVPAAPLDILSGFGTVPLPPYIDRPLATPEDRARYQTTFARESGAIAAPTAGLHFTPELLEQCAARGVPYAFVTLHVGLGTFRPISVEQLDHHRMHSEWCELPAATSDLLNQTRATGGRIVAVGTTSVRTLESAAAANLRSERPMPPFEFRPWSGHTDLFIRPPYRFQAVDALLTNFHLPRSTLLVLVSALAGRDLILRAYREAIEHGYRFYSYGDAMLIE